MKKLKRIWSSLSVRINIFLFVVMLIMGYVLVRTTTVINDVITNGSENNKMVTALESSINGELHAVENVLHSAVALSWKGHLSPEQLRYVRDNAGNYTDSVYLVRDISGRAEIDSCLVVLREDTIHVWSEPYTRGKKNIVTLVVPTDKSRNTAVCADVSLDWLRDMINNSKTTENTSIVILSPKNRYVYCDDFSKICKVSTKEKYEGGGNWEEYPMGASVDHEEYQFKSNNDIARAGWEIQVRVPLRDQSQTTLILNVAFIVILVMMFLIVSIFIMLTIRWMVRPLRRITDAADAVAKGNFDTELPVIRMDTDIKHLRDSFVVMQNELSHYIADLRDTTEQKAILERDIYIAAKIQKGMMPHDYPSREDLDIHGVLIPAKVVGGDLLDFFIHDEKLIFCLGDVSGKGVPAALFMSATVHLFRSVGHQTEEPSQIVSSINDGLADGNDENMFCTLFVGVLDLKTGVLNYCNAGHNAPVLISSEGAAFLPVKPNIPTGTFDGFQFSSETVQFVDNDVLLLYTDGITEAENQFNEQYGDAALIDVVSALRQCDMKELTTLIHSSVNAFVGDAEQSDDITMLAIRWRQS